MLTVACVLRSGGIYTPEWVARLKAGVSRHLPVKHRFVCLSDVEVPAKRIPLEHGWPGWWAKMELFRIPGPVLYFDLDTAIVGDLSDIAEHATYAAGMTMLRDFYAPDHCGSGVMAWSGSMRALYDVFAKDADRLMTVQRARMGDQAFIEEETTAKLGRWQDHLPGQICSFKVHCRGSRVPLGTRVICLHGQPKSLELLSKLNDSVPGTTRGDDLCLL